MGLHERPTSHPGGCSCAYYAFADLLFRIEALEARMTWTQDDVNAITAELHDGLGRVQDEIANLEAAQAAGQDLDLTALKAEADAVANVVPAPAPVPDPAPVDPTTDPTTDPTAGGTTDPTTDPSAPVVDPGTSDPTQGGTVDPTVPSDPTTVTADPSTDGSGF